MAETCFNVHNPQYQTLKLRSGITEDDILVPYCSYYLETYGRYPHLDELPKPDSKPHIKELLSIRADNSVHTQELLDNTKCNTIEEAEIALNDTYRDLQVHILELSNDSIVTTETKPNFAREDTKNTVNIDKHVDHDSLFRGFKEKLQANGVNIITTNEESIYASLLNVAVPNALSAKGFIFNGDIYINTSNATVDTELHEMLHLLIGAMRFSDSEHYSELLLLATKIPLLPSMRELIGLRTQNDVLEELLVTELSKYIMLAPSAINNMPYNLQYELRYSIIRVLDSVLMGNRSAATLSTNQIGAATMRDLAQKLESAALNLITRSTLLEATIHRIMANRKSELLQSKQLREECI